MRYKIDNLISHLVVTNPVAANIRCITNDKIPRESETINCSFGVSAEMLKNRKVKHYTSYTFRDANLLLVMKIFAKATCR